MNKVILMGRLTREPEVRYSSSDRPVAVARFSLAVNRRFKREGEPEADFINCVALGKNGEFVEKYFKKGQMVSVIGRIQVRHWDDKDGNKRTTTEVIIEENYFAESKKNSAAGSDKPSEKSSENEFCPIDESVEDEDLPF